MAALRWFVRETCDRYNERSCRAAQLHAGKALMTLLETLILGSYFFVLVILGVYGWHRYYLVYVYMKNKDQVPGRPPAWDGPLPPVTIQLPIYNEMYVVDRLLEATARDRLPEGAARNPGPRRLDRRDHRGGAAGRASVCVAAGLRHQVPAPHRPDRLQGRRPRRGPEGGAAASSSPSSTPTSSRARTSCRRRCRTSSDPKVALVQARWGHVNADYSLLTKVAGHPARRPLRARARRPQPRGPLLQLQRHGRRLAARRSSPTPAAGSTTR